MNEIDVKAVWDISADRYRKNDSSHCIEIPSGDGWSSRVADLIEYQNRWYICWYDKESNTVSPDFAEGPFLSYESVITYCK